jgi:TRAP-type mannitol/chloroaromatic compound transport system permease small subunit
MLLGMGMDGAGHIIEAYFTSTKFQELEWHLHAALFLLCLGFGYVRNSHVRIEIVRERFDTRTKATLEIIGCTIFLLPYACLVLYFGIDFAERSYEMNEVSSALTGLTHRWIIKSFVPIGMVLLLLAGVAVALRNIAYLMDPRGEAGSVYDIAYELHNPEEELRRLEEAELEEIKAESEEHAILSEHDKRTGE